MTLLNALLALGSVLMWGTVFTWYFWRDVRDLWRTRNDKWFRGD